MSTEINYHAQELSVQELDVVAGGAGIDQLLAKDFDASFQTASIKDARAINVGPNGVQTVEVTEIDQTKTVASDDLLAIVGDF
ncbi:CTB family bacteriocin [Phormidesmis sp. 146-35]